MPYGKNAFVTDALITFLRYCLTTSVNRKG